MKVIQLPYESKAGYDYTHKVVLTYADLTDDDAAQTVNLIPAIVGDVVQACAAKLVTAFDSSDATLTSTTVEIGHNDTVADPNAFLVSAELNVSGTEIIAQVHPSTTPHVFVAGTVASPKYIQAAFGCTAEKLLNTHNVGELHLYLKIARLANI